MNEPLQVRVTARNLVADDIAAFDLAAMDGGTLPAFEAGAHIDVTVPGGPVRQYSLYELPDGHRYRIAVLRDPHSRGGSARLLDAVNVGDLLSISEPRNHFALRPGKHRSLLFAGGIGITPMLCMAEQLHRDNADFHLHYCGRTLARMAFVDRLSQCDYAQKVSLHPDNGSAPEQLDARTTIGPPAQDKHLYVCGPNGYMDHVLATARSLGWDEAHLHREYFGAAPIDHFADRPFELELKRRGMVIHVAANESAAQALIAAGVDIPLSCEQGVCGTCLSPVVAGVPDHRDLYLTDEEHARNDCFMPCCSRARSARLVLDL
jgi:vanillate O-demethylase ferredoxin subunit